MGIPRARLHGHQPEMRACFAMCLPCPLLHSHWHSAPSPLSLPCPPEHPTFLLHAPVAASPSIANSRQHPLTRIPCSCHLPWTLMLNMRQHSASQIGCTNAHGKLIDQPAFKRGRDHLPPLQCGPVHPSNSLLQHRTMLNTLHAYVQCVLASKPSMSNAMMTDVCVQDSFKNRQHSFILVRHGAPQAHSRQPA